MLGVRCKLTNFEAFRWNISLRTNLLFLKNRNKKTQTKYLVSSTYTEIESRKVFIHFFFLMKKIIILIYIFNSFPATLGSFSCGCGIGWSSPTLPNIDPELCDEDECDITDVPEVLVPWIGSLFLLGGVIAGPLAFSILDRIGRKKTLMGLSLPMLLGYGMLTASYYLDNIIVLLIGRFLAGK